MFLQIHTCINVLKSMYIDIYKYTTIGMHVYSASQSCLTLCNRMDCSPPGSSVHGIFQARILEQVAISYCRGSSQPGNKPSSLASLAVEGRFFTTAPSGKPSKYLSTGHMQGVVHQENISIDPFPLLPFLSYLILSLLTLLIFTYFTYLPYLIFTSSPGMTVQLSCSVVSDYL